MHVNIVFATTAPLVRKHRKDTPCAGNLRPAMGARNQVGIGLSYRPASLCSLATQYQNRFLESIPRPIAGLKIPTLSSHLLVFLLFSCVFWRLEQFEPEFVNVWGAEECFVAACSLAGRYHKWGCRTGKPGYIGWRNHSWNRFLGSLNVYKFRLSVGGSV